MTAISLGKDWPQRQIDLRAAGNEGIHTCLAGLGELGGQLEVLAAQGVGRARIGGGRGFGGSAAR